MPEHWTNNQSFQHLQDLLINFDLENVRCFVILNNLSLYKIKGRGTFLKTQLWKYIEHVKYWISMWIKSLEIFHKGFGPNPHFIKDVDKEVFLCSVCIFALFRFFLTTKLLGVGVGGVDWESSCFLFFFYYSYVHVKWPTSIKWYCDGLVFVFLLRCILLHGPLNSD